MFQTRGAHRCGRIDGVALLVVWPRGGHQTGRVVAEFKKHSNVISSIRSTQSEVICFDEEIHTIRCTVMSRCHEAQ